VWQVRKTSQAATLLLLEHNLISKGLSDAAWMPTCVCMNWSRCSYLFLYSKQKLPVVARPHCRLWSTMHPWVDFQFRHYIYCLYRMLPRVSFFLLHFFLTYLLPYLSFPLRIDPLLFQAWCRKRWLNLALVFCVCFVLQYISSDWWMRTFVMLGLGFSQTKPGDWLGETSPKWLFCVEWGIKPQLRQSVWTNRDAVWDVDSDGPKKPRTKWRPGLLRGRGNFEGIFWPIVMYRAYLAWAKVIG